MPKEPAHQTVYRRLRDMILCGEMEPGQAVTIQGLVAELDAGMTPVREAIRRLTSEHALEFKDNRRVGLPVLNRAEIDEISFARLALEPQLAMWAAAKITPEQIDQLAAIDEDLNRAIDRGDIQTYLIQNYRFHSTLYAASQAATVIALVDALWLRLGPSLRVMRGRFGTASLDDRHAVAVEALRVGDIPAVGDAIRLDIEQGFNQIRLSMRD
ncbi:MAG: GntR family transcriptional regulator [Marivivens sp.]|nr:GntR family transcriptional regulator [Marivivens sp. JLT3646]NBQ51834.1 GntR family transcriptional regulator [Marivivens sp.]OBR39981.1 GntR family transcriptional regulator [Donghicola sp. JL3646]NCW70150.1 GntR family transcriptional regulator [Marivivens sp.]NDH04207.1 GntR family transcriptional regulator [Marivivens sp.]